MNQINTVEETVEKYEQDTGHDVAEKPTSAQTTDSQKTDPEIQKKYTHDVQNHMDIGHFEKLQATFLSHRNEDGSGGFDIDKFREVFGTILGGNLSYDQMTMLFMKIDANSDGTIDWDEFSNYMMMGAMDSEPPGNIFDDRVKRYGLMPHKDVVKRIDYITKERKYMSVNQDGTICIWNNNLKIQRVFAGKDYCPGSGWVADAVFLQDQNKLAVITDDRRLYLYDMLSIKPRLLLNIGPLENNPTCIAYAPQYDDNIDLILFGDDGGCVNALYLNRQFYIEAAGESDIGSITPSSLNKREHLAKHNLYLYRQRKVHNDWVLKVQFYSEMNCFVSCSSDSTKSLVLGDLQRKTTRTLDVPKGVNAFAFCRRPSFLVTGGRGKIIRLWNPYVLSKAAGSLHGHNAPVLAIVVNNENSHIISMSEDKVIKIWNARNLNCLQTLMDKTAAKDGNYSQALYDSVNRQLIVGTTRLESIPLYRSFKREIPRSHDAGVTAALFNDNFHQVVSGCQNSTVSIWDIASGEKAFQFHNVHDKYEITAMCFDNSGRRLITASRDGVVKMWNFNNGQLLRRMLKDTHDEVTDVIYVEMGSNKYIVATGWDRKITVFVDDINHFETRAIRTLSGKENGNHKGHDDDILSMAFCPPNILATSSIDGVIIIWNLESGYPKLSMKEPFLHLRSIEEKAIEKILFLQKNDNSNIIKDNVPLISCHADGCIRFWDVNRGMMVSEMSVQLEETDGASTICLNVEATLLFVGDTKGRIRVYDVAFIKLQENYMNEEPSGCNLMNIWKAHPTCISSIGFVDPHQLVLTASSDATIRVWRLDGSHIGIFGQSEPWSLRHFETVALPSDVQHLTHKEEIIKVLRDINDTAAKTSLIAKMKGMKNLFGKPVAEKVELPIIISSVDGDNASLLSQQDRPSTSSIPDYVKKKTDASAWDFTPDLLIMKSQKNFFNLDSQRKKRTLKTIQVKSDFVYHTLEYYGLEEIHMPAIPTALMKMTKSDPFRTESKPYPNTATYRRDTTVTGNDAIKIKRRLGLRKKEAFIENQPSSPM